MDKPLDLNLHIFETMSLVLTVITVTFVIADGRANWLKVWRRSEQVQASTTPGLTLKALESTTPVSIKPDCEDDVTVLFQLEPPLF